MVQPVPYKIPRSNGSFGPWSGLNHAGRQRNHAGNASKGNGRLVAHLHGALRLRGAQEALRLGPRHGHHHQVDGIHHLHHKLLAQQHLSAQSAVLRGAVTQVAQQLQRLGDVIKAGGAGDLAVGQRGSDVIGRAGGLAGQQAGHDVPRQRPRQPLVAGLQGWGKGYIMRWKKKLGAALFREQSQRIRSRP